MDNEEMVKVNNDNAQKYRGVFDFVSTIALAVVIVAIAFTFFFRTVGVSGSSMFPTLHDKDRIILSAYDKDIKPGQIVVTCQPSNYIYIEPTLVKRVIATEGQTVAIDFVNGVVYVDGVALDEPYISEPATDPEDFYNMVGHEGYFTVPEGHVFVMGDNRNASTDSRDMRVGTIREEYILGKAYFRMMPFGQFKIG